MRQSLPSASYAPSSVHIFVGSFSMTTLACSIQVCCIACSPEGQGLTMNVLAVDDDRSMAHDLGPVVGEVEVDEEVLWVVACDTQEVQRQL